MNAELLLLFVGCFTSKQHASVSQGPTYSDNCMCCYTGIEVTDQTCYLTQLQYTETRRTSPSADPIMPDTWQGSHWVQIFMSMVWLDLEIIHCESRNGTKVCFSQGGHLTVKQTKRYMNLGTSTVHHKPAPAPYSICPMMHKTETITHKIQG